MSELIRNPPTWLIVIVISVLTAHALDKVIEIVNRHKGHNGLIPILELFVILVLGFLAIHAYRMARRSGGTGVADALADRQRSAERRNHAADHIEGAARPLRQFAFTADQPRPEC